jgi:hypothetical protein
MHCWKQEYKKRKRNEAVHPVFYGPDETLADLKFLCIKLRSIKRVLEVQDLVGRMKHGVQKRVTRLWVGCGSASAATMNVWNDIGGFMASIHHIH